MKKCFRLIVLLLPVFIVSDLQGGEMPDGFEALYLGAKWENVLSIRPNARLVNFGPDRLDTMPKKDKPTDGLIEQFDTGPIKLALYAFRNGYLSACSFTFSSEQRNGEFLLKDYLMQYGKTEIVSSSLEHGYGLIGWSTENKKIFLLMSMKVDTKKGYVVYQVMDLPAASDLLQLRETEFNNNPIDQNAEKEFAKRIKLIEKKVLLKVTSNIPIKKSNNKHAKNNDDDKSSKVLNLSSNSETIKTKPYKILKSNRFSAVIFILATIFISLLLILIRKSKNKV